MLIYTVQSGDTLYNISQRYQVTVDNIRSVNGLVNTNIVPGQALLININTYTVQQGDNFYLISQLFDVPVDTLIALNPGIDPNGLQPGMSISLPEPQRYDASTFNYFYITETPLDVDLIRDFAPYTTYYSFFEYTMQPDGSLSPLNDLPAIEAAWNYQSAPIATITNLTAVGFSGALTSQVLNNVSTRQRLIDEIFTLVTQKGYAGVNIDFEGIFPADRDVFSTFLNTLGTRLHDAGLLLTIAVPPIAGEAIDWHEGFDYGAIGSVVDFMFIMAYDWHHPDSQPGPVAPINEVRRTIEFALQNMPPNKIVLGVPLYGYEWTLPYNPAVRARAVSIQEATEIAMNYQVPISYSTELEAPYIHYYDETGQHRVIYFEDTRSIAAKMELVREHQLYGIGAWQIGLPFPQGPWLLTRFFNIRHVT